MTLSLTNPASYSNPTPQNEPADEIDGLPASTADSLPLIINHGDIEECIPVPVNVFGEATIVKQDYLRSLTAPDDGIPHTLPAPETSIELVAGFLDFCIGAGSSAYHIARFVLDYFEFMYLGANDVHVVICALPVGEQSKVAILQSYLTARYIIRHSVKQPSSALFRAAEQKSIRLHAIFGGQGLTKAYFEELKGLYDAYSIYLEQFITKSARQLKQWSISTQDESERVMCPTINLMDWLSEPESCPADMTNPALSFPLIGLVQLARYSVVCQSLGLTPGQFCRRFSGFAGHSQGIVTAVALAASDTWKDFYDNAAIALTTLCSIGLRGQQCCSLRQVDDAGVRDAVLHGEGRPSPMLSIRHLARRRLDQLISNLNSHLPEKAKVELALVNGPETFVVSGPPPSLYALCKKLRPLKVAPTDSQTGIPHSKRKLRFSTQFLQVGIPYHSKYLESAVHKIIQDVDSLQIRADDLQIPVFGGSNSDEVRTRGETDTGNVLPALIRAVTCERVQWEEATLFPGSTHVVDFGPGANSGIASLTAENKRGMGVRFILAGSFLPSNSDFGSAAELFNANSKAVVACQNWRVDNAPTLTRTPGRQVIISTRLSRLLGLPPFIVAGMTPTTKHWDFVAAVMNAGYHAELAGGGYNSEEAMETALRRIAANIPPGRGITINLLYLSPVTLAWQIPLIKRLRLEGINIDGLTVGGGVPHPDVVAEYIGLGVRHISFKPGSETAIHAVIDIAKAYPEFPVILQWTGGRGGGHHSNEDFHQPVIRTYSKMRQLGNLILVAGSGFGEENGADTYPYLTGSWSEQLGHVAMPYDGILYGSRMMVAKEAHTSLAAKKAIAAASGAADACWEETMSKRSGSGAIISVKSEMGQPIHKIATRGILLWAEMDRDIFSLPRDKLIPALKAKKKYIISRLNADYQKVWFGIKDGKPADLQDMTYAEVGERLTSLLFRVKTETRPARWIDSSWFQMVSDFLHNTEARFRGHVASSTAKGGSSWPQMVATEPYRSLSIFLQAYPQASERLMSDSDIQSFLDLCRRRGQKPIPFIPALDENFETYFKKDSLWQSEDPDSLVDGDVERTCILHGPVAAQYSSLTNINQPVGDMLSKINSGVMNMLKAAPFEDEKLLVSPPAELKHEFNSGNVPLGILVEKDSDSITYHIPPIEELRLTSASQWLQMLAGPRKSWRHSLLTTDQVVQGQVVRANPVKKLLEPRRGYWYKLMSPGHVERSSIMMMDEDKNTVVDISFQRSAGNIILVKLFHHSTPDATPACLMSSYEYRPEVVFAPLREVMDQRNTRIKEFYHHVWLGQEESQIRPTLPSGEDISLMEFPGQQTVVSRDLIHRFTRAVGAPSLSSDESGKLQVSIDLAIVLGWKALVSPLVSDILEGDLSRLVHLSNSFKSLDKPLEEGDVVDSRSRITSIVLQSNGKVVEVECDILRKQKPIILITSRFLIRATTIKNTGVVFQRTSMPAMEIPLRSAKEVALFRSRKFVSLSESLSNDDFVGNSAVFNLQTIESTSMQTGVKSVLTTGTVSIVGKHVNRQVGVVSSHSTESGKNPAVGYVKRYGKLVEEVVTLENAISLLDEPKEVDSSGCAEKYARASGDYNPIHTSRTFASICGLPGTIQHGMHTSALVHSVLHQWAGGLDRVRSYQVSFVGMVEPGERISVSLHHTGMISGRKIIKVEAFKGDEGEIVLKGEAEVEERSSGYVFTGQGSQEVGMGMALAQTSPAAKEVWDRADSYFHDHFGKCKNKLQFLECGSMTDILSQIRLPVK